MQFGLGGSVRVQRGTVPRRLGWPAKWSVVEGPAHGTISSVGFYQAPLTLPAVPAATVQVRLADFAGSVGRAAVHLPDLPPDTTPCNRLGQVLAPSPGDYVYVDSLPEVITKVVPEYPDSAIRVGAQGTVMLLALVCPSGFVSSVYVVRSVPLLDEAAMAAVIRWTWHPASAQGVPVAVWVAVPVRFTIGQGQTAVDVGEPRLPDR
jgi:TonB family protein